MERKESTEDGISVLWPWEVDAVDGTIWVVWVPDKNKLVKPRLDISHDSGTALGEALVKIGLLLLLGLAAGCAAAPHDVAKVDLDTQAPFGVIPMGGTAAYLIDPRTESCFLFVDKAIAVVPCGPLKKNLPAAAKYITWDPGH
jgi:hypothetical protein